MTMSSEQRQEKNIQRLHDLLEIVPEYRRMNIEKMLDSDVTGLEYVTAPASTREDFHSCFPGGLLDHSLRVVDLMNKLCKAWGYEASQQSIVICGLLHDLGKTGDGARPYYLPNDNEYARRKGNLYVTNPDCLFMPTSERSLYLCSVFDITLDPGEYQAIRLNDGQYDENNRAYRMREHPLSLLLHFSDRWAVEVEKNASGEPGART